MFNKREVIRISVLLIAFIILGIAVANDSQGILFDREILETLHKDQNSDLFKFSQVLAFLGSGLVVGGSVVFVSIILYMKEKYYEIKILFAGSLGSYGINFISKFLINRTRPVEYMKVEQAGYSFPSGHSMIAMSFILTIAYLICRKDFFKNKKILVYFPAIIYIVLMGFSRLYLGVHWPTDVIGGFILGYVVYTVNTRLIQE